jgi:predicted  nucleic acid-binding Zn-ribbon protein
MAGGGALYEFNRTESLQQQLNETRESTSKIRATAQDSDARWQKAVSDLRGEIDLSREQVNHNVTTASRRSEQAARNQVKAISAELSKVKETAQEASTALQGISTEVGSVKSDVGAVRTDVTTVRTDVDAVKSDVAISKVAIDETRIALQRTRGDLGEMSGLIATNSGEIQQLRALGDRTIYEFTLTRGSLQKVGDIQVMLKKADKSHSRFTLDVLADDKRVEKKNRTINEPVQFYTSQARQPYELVINQVMGDKVVGYLAAPKVTVARTSPR